MFSGKTVPIWKNILRCANISQSLCCANKQTRTLFSHEIRIKYKPPVNPNPILVRPESELKSIVQLDPSYPVLINRLEEIRFSPLGWINRMVLPPQLPYDVKRRANNRFDIVVELKGRGKKRGWYTTLYRIQGDVEELKNCLQWRLGPNHRCTLYNSHSIEIRGFHRVTVSTLLQGLGL